MFPKLQHTGCVDDLISRVNKLNLNIREILIGCESGVELYDHFATKLGFSTNGTKFTEARRNKYLMGEAVREAGLRAVKQIMTCKWEDIPPFVDTLNSASFVLKPVDSAGSDGVYFCRDLEEARRAYDAIMGATNIFGDSNTRVLAQEFLKGKEYVVDTMSYNGHHKVTAFWCYDKRRMNGSQFVYYGVHLFESEDREIEQKLAAYCFGVLDALGIKNGPGHAEAMWLEDENQPCLVEVGARPHGGEGTFVDMTSEAIGYHQLSVALDLIDGPQEFHSLPQIPMPLKAYAAEVCLVSTQDGILKEFKKGLVEIKAMESFLYEELHVPEGGKIKKTVDIVSSPGSIMIVHKNKEQMMRDFDRIHEIELEDLFDIVSEL